MESLSSAKGLSSAFGSPTFDEDGSFRLDKPVGSASISPCGRDIVLASRQGLHIIDLDSPWSPPRHLSHHTPWEVADVQWSPFAARDYWVVSTSNQKALVWNLEMKDSRASIEHYLHAHTRAITDINFSAHHPDILATCAVDSYVHCWDLRHPSRAAITFCDWFAGATQVKWNRQNPHVLASSHDKFLRIWDDRKGAHPLRSIEAHATKIYGVDWNRTETNNVATCSLDRTIKFWDYTSAHDVPEATIQTSFPVSRARHTPFGAGLLAMPQRNDFDLHLYDRRSDDQSQQPDAMAMVHRFDGHEGQVKEFLWRARGSVENSTDSRDFQLVSWGTDRVLRLHRLDEKVLGKVGFVKGQQVRRTIPFTRRNAPYKTFRGDPSGTIKDIDSIFGQLRPGSSFQPNTGMSSLSSIGQNGHVLGVSNIWATTEIPSASMAGKQIRSRNDVEAISWMKGVKIGKRETRPVGVDQSVSSVLSPVLKSSQPWDSFDSLAEEITHLADKFSKVAFENINMDYRQIILSLHGPWGVGRASAFVKCSIEVPSKYPDEESPWVSIENTAEMSDESILQATSEVQLIARAYQEWHRHSLEAILRYLLGEQNYSDTLALLRASRDRSGMELDDHDEFSSSDEEDTNGQYASIQDREWDSNDVIAVSNAQFNVPLPKACGALWADDGRLVCFFPPKQDKPPSFLQPISLKSGEWTTKNQKSVLEGFGRLQSGSSISKMAVPTADSTESGDSDFDDSSGSSSGSSSSNGNPSSHLRLIPSMAWRDGVQESTRALSIDESQRSDRPNGRVKSAIRYSKNFVSIRDCAELLPAKRTLAAEYQLDSTSKCCLHNAGVARKYGKLELADIWEFLNLILQDAVPLERIDITSTQEPITVVARRAISPLQSRDSAIDLSYDAHDDDQEIRLKGQVYWGAHPFGSRWLVKALFEHFEQLADIQMLAMLSCVLQAPRTMKSTQSTMSCSDLEPGARHDFQAFPASHPLAAMERYYPFAEAATHANQPLTTKPTFRLELPNHASDSQSAGSSVGASTSDPMTPYSTGLTPPSSMKPNQSYKERSLSETPLSTSPEQYKHAHRSSSNLASAFAASLVRPFSFSTPDSSSPPTAYPRKRSSPSTSYSGAATSHQIRGKGSTDVTTTRLQTSSSLGRKGSKSAQVKHSSFETKLKNQSQFQNDGYAAEHLLDSAEEARYSAYRSIYADMLLTWELPVASTKVLQFNPPGLGRLALQMERRDQELNESLILSRKCNSSIITGDTVELQLEFREHCSNCNNMVPQNTPGNRCRECSAKHDPLVCQLCQYVIHGHFSPCPNCGHVLHLSCRYAIEHDKDDSLGEECITGCGCKCAIHIRGDVHHPVTKNTPVVPASAAFVNDPQESGWSDGADDNEDANTKAQGNVAYESLARNLGARFLTPKPSQILRGGEPRKASLSGFAKIRRSGPG